MAYRWDEKTKKYVKDTSETKSSSAKSVDSGVKQEYVSQEGADEWQSFLKSAYTKAAANDIGKYGKKLPATVDTFEKSKYALGGGQAVKDAHILPNLKFGQEYMPVAQNTVVGNRDYFNMSDEEFQTYIEASKTDSELAKELVPYVMARTGGLDSIDMTGMTKAQMQELQNMGNLYQTDYVYDALSKPADEVQKPNIGNLFDDPDQYAQFVASGASMPGAEQKNLFGETVTNDDQLSVLLGERKTYDDYLKMYTAYPTEALRKDLMNIQSYNTERNVYNVTPEQYEASRARVYAATGTDYDSIARESGGADNKWMLDVLGSYQAGEKYLAEIVFGEISPEDWYRYHDAYKNRMEYSSQKGNKLDAWENEANRQTQAQLNKPGNIDYYRPAPMYLNIDPTYLEGHREYQNEDNTYMPAEEFRENAINEWLMAYVNAGNDEAKIAELDAIRGEYLPELEQYNLEKLKYIDEDQKKAIFSAYNNGDVETAKNLIQTYDPILNYQRVSDMEEAWADKYTDASTAGKIGMNVQSVGQNVGTALEGVKQAVWSIVAPDELKKITEYDPAYDKTRKANITRQLTGSELAQATYGVNIPLTDRNLVESIYHGVMSGADSFVISSMLAPLGPAAQAIAMGGISYANERMNKLQEGYSDEDANMDAWAQAFIEGVTEYIPFDIMSKNSPNAWRKALGGIYAGTVGEAVSELGGALYDEVKYGNYRDQLLVEGNRGSDASLWMKWAKYVAPDVASAAVGGLVGEMPQNVTSAVSDSIQNDKFGDALRTNEGIEALADMADTVPVSDTAKSIVERMRAEIAESKNGAKSENAVDDKASITKADAAVEARETEAAKRDRAERAEDGKTVEEQTAGVTKADAEAAVRETEQTARDKKERAAEGKETVEEDAAAVTKEDADAMMREADQIARDISENADKGKGEKTGEATKEGGVTKAEAEAAVKKIEQTARDKGARAKEGKRAKPVSNAEIGFVYREVIKNLDKGAQQVVAKVFSRNVLETALAKAGFRGDMRKAADIVEKFINGDTRESVVKALENNAAMRSVALDFIGDIGAARAEYYSKAADVAERAKKDYAKGENTKADKAAQEATKGIEDAEAEAEAAYEAEESMVDGNAVTIEGVASVDEDGSVTYNVKDADGNVTEVSEAEVQMGQVDSMLDTIVQNAKELGKDAETMIRMYAKNQDAAEYSAAFKAAVQMGEDGRNLDVVKGYSKLGALTEDQITAAYEVGRGMRTRRNTAVRKNASGIEVGKVDTKAIAGVELTAHQRKSVHTMSRLANAVGFNVRFVKSKANAEGRYTTENGSWDPDTLTLTLDIHAGSNIAADQNYAMMHTAGHELTHYIKQFADGELWNAYQEFVVGHLSTKTFDLEGEIEKYTKNGLSRDDAIEEVIANASGEALNGITEADIQAKAETNPGLLNKVKQFFARWIKSVKAAIKAAYQGTEAKDAAAKEMMDVVDEMSKRWNDLLVNAVKNRQTGDVVSETTNKVSDNTENIASEPLATEEMRTLINAHIDQRTFDSVAETDMDLFAAEAEEAQIGMAAAAKILLNDLENSLPGQKVWKADGEVTGQKRQTSELLGRMKDELKLTWDKLRQNLQQFANMETSDVLPKNTLNNRRIELYLNEMLTDGYTALDGTEVNAWDEYINVMQEYDGTARKKYSPKNGAVDFVDYAWPGEVKYSKRGFIDAEKDSIKNQIEEHRAELNAMEPVFAKTINVPKVKKEKLVEWATAELASTGYRVERQGFGRIVFDKNRIDDSFDYLNTTGEFAAIMAVPRVLKRGIFVGEHDSHKYRGFPTITFAAPVEINGIRGNMAVVVKRESKNTYKTHRIVMPDGSAFIYKENAEPTPARGVANTGSYALPIGTASENSVSQHEPEVKKFSARMPVELLNAREDLKFQKRDFSNLSDRELLVQALETDLTPAERDHLERYKAKVEDIGKDQRRLEEVTDKIAELRNAGYTAKTSEELRKAENNAKTLRGKINRVDADLKKIESAAMIQEVIKRNRAEVRKQAYDQARQRAEERWKREVEKAKQTGRDRMKKEHAHQEFEKYRKQLLTDVKKLHTWVTAPTSKAHAPQFLREPLAKLIQMFNFDSESKLRGIRETYSDAEFKEMFSSLSDAITKLTDQQNDIENGAEMFMGYVDLPANFRQNFSENVQSIKKMMDEAEKRAETPINRMTAEQMKELATAFRILNHSILKMNEFVSSGRGTSAKVAADNTIDELTEMKARMKTNKVIEEVNGRFNWKNTTPYYVFQRLGEGGKHIFERLQNGWDKMAHNSAQVVEFAEDAFTEAERAAWSGEITEVKLDNGETIKMTTAQKMSIYCLQKRQQAQGHLLGGGIRVADITEKLGKKISQADNYVLTVDDIARITGSLTKRQREVADKLQRFMNTVCSDWGNEINMKRFGFKQMTEMFYFPIETDANNRRKIDETKDGTTSMFRLLNMSSLKPLTPNANNAIVIHDIFDVFSDHASNMAKYNAMALPILDFIKWYNHVERSEVRDDSGQTTGQIKTRSVQKALERAYGNDAKSYLTKFIQDLNAEQDGGRDDSGLVNGLISRAKSASVGANLRVYALQITSLPRAAYAINPKYLAMGAAKMKNLNPINAIKGTEAQEEIGILKWKKMGFYSTDIARSIRSMIKKDAGFLEKLRDWSMLPAGWGDNWVSNVIYEAAKAEMKVKHPNLRPDSADYKRVLNERVREIIYKTQVVDSTMTRSQLMRSKGINSLFTAFMSEPTITMNMLNESVQKAVMLGRKGASTKEILRATGGLAVRSATTFAINAFVTAMFESVFDALRDDDEYETFIKKFLDAMWGTEDSRGNFVDNLNPITMLPMLNDAWSIIVDGYEDNSLMTQVLSQGKDFMDAIKSYRDGKSTLYKVIYRGAQTAGSIGGVGLGNAVRDFASIYNTFLAPAWGTPKWQTSADTVSTAATAYYEAKKAGKTSEAAYYKERMQVGKMDMEKVTDKIVKSIGDDYVAGSITEAEARSWLKAETKYDSEKIDTKMRDWSFKKETGVNYSDFKSAYTSGTISKKQAEGLLKKYRGYDDNKVYFTLAEWDGGEGWSKYDDFLDAVDRQGNFAAEAKKLLDRGVNKKDIAGEIADAYKDAYREVHGTPEGERLLEYLLDVYEAIGYDRDYERKYITKNWIKD